MKQRIPFGQAEAVPETPFHAIAGRDAGLAPLSKIDVQMAVDRLSSRFGLSSQRNTSKEDQVGVVMPVHDQQAFEIFVKLVPAPQMLRQAVCAYTIFSPTKAEITVSESCHHDHLERGLAHEFAELNFACHLRLKHGHEPTHSEAIAIFQNAPLPQSDTQLTKRLTPHDIGRISELDYVFGVRGSGGMSVKHQWFTLLHLGLGPSNPDATKRTELLKKLPPEIIDPRTVQHIQLRQSTPPMPSLVPPPTRQASPPPTPAPTETATFEPTPDPVEPEEVTAISEQAKKIRPSTIVATEEHLSAYHRLLSDELATTLDRAWEVDQIWTESKAELADAEENYANAAGATGVKLKNAEIRCREIAEQLKVVRQAANASEKTVELQIALRQAHFELGQLKEVHNKSMSEREAREHHRQIHITRTKENKIAQDAREALTPVLELVLRSLNLQHLGHEQWRLKRLSELRIEWTQCDRTLREELQSVLIPTKDAFDSVERLRRDSASIQQQLERVEGRNNNQRQVDSLTNRQQRVTRELERAERQLTRCTGALHTEWTKESIAELRAEWQSLNELCTDLANSVDISSVRDEELRASTRTARLNAIERQIQLTLENILGQVQEQFDRLVQDWGNPNAELTTAEEALAKALGESEVWEQRDQLKDMYRQRLELKHPVPTSLPDPTSFKLQSD